MCSKEVGPSSKADVHLADTANCQPVYLCVWVNKCVCICAFTENTRRANIRKKTRRHPIWLQAISFCQKKMIERAVINAFFFSACDLQGSILPFPPAHVPLSSFLLIYCLPLYIPFILFQRHQVITLVLLRLSLHAVSCGYLSDVSLKPPWAADG